jgi:multicomponent Na+:H+ antiporter subunit E
MAPSLHWLFLFFFWLTLSGVFDAKHIGIGIVATAAVAFGGRRMQSVGFGAGDERQMHLASVRWAGVYLYALWLFRAIVEANIEIVRVVFDPRLPIDPAMVRVPTRVSSDVEITLLANSITATPGTITVRGADEEHREFLVHCLVHPDKVPAAVHLMEDRVLRALGSGKV